MLYFLFLGLPSIISALLMLICIHSFEKLKEKTDETVKQIEKHSTIHSKMFGEDLRLWHSTQKSLEERVIQHEKRIAEVEKIAKIWIKGIHQ